MPLFSALQNLKINTAEVENQTSPYMHCNEQFQADMLMDLQSRFAQPAASSAPPSVHIGFSVWLNLDILTIAPVDYAIILDFDPMVSLIYENIELSLKESADRHSFVTNLLEHLEKDQRDLLKFPLDYEKNLFNEKLSASYGFLSSDDNFKRVKTMCENGLIFFGQADMTNTDNMQLIANWCKTNNVVIKTLYLSNIMEWLLQHSQERFTYAIDNLQPLIKSQTYVIDAFYPTTKKDRSGPPLRITQGEFPSFKLTPLRQSSKRAHTQDSSDDEEIINTQQNHLTTVKFTAVHNRVKHFKKPTPAIKKGETKKDEVEKRPFKP